MNFLEKPIDFIHKKLINFGCALCNFFLSFIAIFTCFFEDSAKATYNQNEINELKAKIPQLGDQIASLVQENNTIKAYLKQEKVSLSNFQKQASDLKTLNSSQDQEIQKLHQVISDLKIEKGNMEAIWQSHLNQVKEANEYQISLKNLEIDKLTKEKNVVIDKLAKEKNHACVSIQFYKSKLQEIKQNLTAEKENANQKLSQQMEENAKKEREINRMKTQIDNYEDELAEKDEMIEQIKKELHDEREVKDSVRHYYEEQLAQKQDQFNTHLEKVRELFQRSLDSALKG